MGFPFTINDILIHRRWVERISGFDESFVLNSEDRDFYIRLALAGCSFAGVDRCLAYRRLHADRVFRNLPAKLDTALRSLDTAFENPACPPDVKTLRNASYGTTYLASSFYAFKQGETPLAHEALRTAIALTPSILENNGRGLLRHWVHASVREGGDHEPILRGMMAHFPTELEWLSAFTDTVIARGFLQKGTLDIIWGRLDRGQRNFEKAAEMGIKVDERFLRYLVDLLLSYGMEFGESAMQDVSNNLLTQFRRIGMRSELNWLQASLSINRAFSDYRQRKYRKVPANVLRAIGRDPSYLVNRGVVSVFLRSILGMYSVSSLETDGNQVLVGPGNSEV
jgi:hypothetical protein